MSLLLNEDFSTYLLRHAYLTHIHDGVGERLINLNTSVLNNPAFRAAGWLPDNAAIRRCYSPPIPTTSAGVGVGNEYFNAPRRGGGQPQDDFVEGQEGGMVTGQQGSEDTIGLGHGGTGSGLMNERKRRRTRKEQLEEEDSSDLSDEDSESDKEKSAAQAISFQKMSVRGRSKSSPPPSSQRTAYQLDEEDDGDREGGGLAVMVTSPSKPPETSGLQNQRTRGSSFSSGRVETVKQRARRDTTTSSEMSSENEQLEPGTFFNRKLPGRPDQRARKTVMLSERIQEEENDDLEDVSGEERMSHSDLEDDDDVDEASDLSDEFDVANDESPRLGMMGLAGASDEPSPLKSPQVDVPPPVEPTQNQGGSPTKKAERELSLPKLPKLPPGRPMSRLPPPSLITMGLKGTGGGSVGAGEKPFQRFADMSGKGEASPLWIKIYAPFSSTPADPIEVPLRRAREGQPVTVSELIGLALWRYNEEEYEPPLSTDEKDSNINRWDLRIVEDEEVDYDFPALVRTRPVTDFTSNNNRPPQRRARDKPWDEFGLVRATEEQFKNNEEMTPQIDAMTPLPPQEPLRPAVRPDPAVRTDTDTSIRSVATPTFHPPPRNPITGPSFAPAALRKDTGNLADAPQRETAQSTPRTGAPKTVTVHFTDPQSFATSNLNIPTTADTYIAEIFDHSCHKLGLEKGLYVLKVHGTQTVAPSDRTVEALGDRLGLDLVRRRFIGGAGAGDGIFGLGLSGSPGSSSPNAPLEMLPQQGTPPPGGKKTKRGPAAFGGFTSAPFAAGAGGGPTSSSTNLNLVGLGLALPAELGGIGGKKYNVLRKQPLSFAPSHPRTLIITPEYMQILPAAPDSLAAPTGKVTNVPMNSIIGVKVSRKHPKMVRVLVYREKETKRYDFEASTKEEAGLIVGDVRRALDAGVGLAM